MIGQDQPETHAARRQTMPKALRRRGWVRTGSEKQNRQYSSTRQHQRPMRADDSDSGQDMVDGSRWQVTTVKTEASKGGVVRYESVRRRRTVDCEGILRVRWRVRQETRKERNRES